MRMSSAYAGDARDKNGSPKSGVMHRAGTSLFRV